MRIYQLHVGNCLSKYDENSPLYLKRWSFDNNDYRWYSKHDIINVDTQMQSLLDKGVDIKYGHFSDRKSLRALCKGFINLRRICKEDKIDLVHVFWGSTTALMTVMASPVPVVISFMGSDLIGQVDVNGKNTTAGIISKVLSVISCFLSKNIIVMSEDMKQRLPSGIQKKTYVVPNGVDLEGFHPLSKAQAIKRLGWKQDRKYVLFFSSNNAPVKNRALAKKTFNKIAEKLPEAVFMEITGGIDHADLVYYYNAADILLLTSFHEGSNNSLKEAIACDIPVVSVPCGDASERLKNIDQCYVSNKYDPEELANAALTIMNSGERSNGHEHLDEIRIPYIANRIIEVYKRTLSK